MPQIYVALLPRQDLSSLALLGIDGKDVHIHTQPKFSHLPSTRYAAGSTVYSTNMRSYCSLVRLG